MKVKLEKSIQEFLEDFNLSDREVAIYITLLKMGPSTIMNLSRETGVKRSTTHNNVEELIKKGLVSQTNFGERRMVVAENPEKLSFLMEQQKWKVEKMEERLPAVVEAIQKMVPKAKKHTEVEVKYYDGLEGISYIYNLAFAASEMRSYVNLGAVSQSFPDNAMSFINVNNRNKKLKFVREIIDESLESANRAADFKKKAKNFEYKVTDKKMGLSSIDVIMFDGMVAMINLGENIRGTVISNKEYYDNSVAIFDFIWNKI